MCAKPIAELNCDEEMHETGFGSSVEHELGLVRLFMCLQKHTGEPVIIEKCQDALKDYKSYLVSDYNLSPQVVRSCDREMRQSCKQTNIDDKHGEGLHCLVSKVYHDMKKSGDESNKCWKALKDIVKVTNVATSNLRLDESLTHACRLAIGV